MPVRVYDYIPFFIKDFSRQRGENFIRTVRPYPKIHQVACTCQCMELPAFFDIIYFFALILGIAGAGLIVYGGLKAIVKILLLEILKGPHTYNLIRRELTDKIVFGLEFLIAADILSTITTPTQEELINLAVVVVIRTILGYFLSKEAAEFSLQG
jgi:uncharacterized membrane protein